MMRALCVGECMIELRAIDDSTMRVGYAGDTYNTAVYLHRTADHLSVDIDVGYLTGLGTDEFSGDMRTAWAREGIADRSIALADKLPGLCWSVPTLCTSRRREWNASSTPPRPVTLSLADIWQPGWPAGRPSRLPGSRPTSQPPSSPTPERSSPRRFNSSRYDRLAHMIPAVRQPATVKQDPVDTRP